MGRIKDYIKVNGNVYWTLFDTVFPNCYIASEIARNLARVKLSIPRRSRLGRKKLREAVLISAEIQDKPISFSAYVIDKIGRDKGGKDIHFLFGALAMKQWGIKLDLKNKKLDLTHYPKEFVEF